MSETVNSGAQQEGFQQPLSPLEQLSRLKVDMDPVEHDRFLTRLRSQSTDLDGRREIEEPWKRGAIYFHPLQDLKLATDRITTEKLDDLDPDHTIGLQACFVQDLDMYFYGFPEEEVEMRGVFQEIFDVGTSFEWEYNLERTVALKGAFTRLNQEVIRPWVIEGDNQ